MCAYKRVSPQPVNEGGTGAITLTNHGVLLGQGTSAITATAVGTTGQVLTGVTGGDPVWASPASSSISITGDTGGALSGSSFTFTGGTSGLIFAGSGSTFTESFDFLKMSAPSTTKGYIALNTDKFLSAGTTATNNNNTFLGVGAPHATSTPGTNNTAVGANCLSSISTSGVNNTAIGSAAGTSINSGTRNTVVGFVAAQQLTTGVGNTAIGSNALNYQQFGTGVITGSYNVGIGATATNKGAGGNYTGSESHNIVISNEGTTGESNVIRIGTTGSGTAQQNKCYIAGINGVNVGSVTSVLTNSGDQLGTATITAGTGISVTAGANSITIASTATALTWSVITADQTAAVNKGYICNKAGTLALALPASSAVGDIIEVTGINTATGWQITQAAGQQIFFGTSSTTLGATGTLTSSNIRDSIKMVCVVANTTWNVISSIGDITIV